MSPLGASASASTRGPASPGPQSGASNTTPSLPSARTAANPSVVSVPSCDGGFHTVASPNATGANFLISTSVIGPNDIWAVGDSENGGGFDQSLAEHWNGSTWAIVATPNFGTFDNDFNGVSAVSTNDVWVAGDYATNSTATGLVATALHWNGSTWTTYSFTPSPLATLYAVTAVSSSNVWAVGTYSIQNVGNATLIEHWDGTAWSLIPSQSPSTFDSELFAVSAWSATDIWAAGRQQSSVANAPLQSLAEHWDGSAWSTIATPNTASGDNEILGVAALEGGHAVGVGYGNYVQVSSIPRRSEGWDLLASGSSTNNISVGGSSLNAPTTNALQGVSKSGAGLWAVGYTRPDLGQFAVRQSVVVPATWNASTHALTWGSVGSSDNPSASNDLFFAVAAVSPYTFWATGYQTNLSNVEQTLAELYCAIHFSLSAPPSTTAGSPFSMTVTAQNGDGSPATGYRGTAQFTSDDGAAVVPAAYTFTPGDNGSHTFSGVVLNSTGNRTITAADSVMPLTMPGLVGVNVLCAAGTCPGPGGTPGPRGANQSSAATASPRSPVNQSGAATPGPRMPKTGPLTSVGSTLNGAASVTTAPAPAAVALAGSTSVQASRPGGVSESHAVRSAVEVQSLGRVTRAAQILPAASQPDEKPLIAVLVIAVLTRSLVFVELCRRKKWLTGTNR